jgi:iron complex outermembrane receptor protein
VALAVGTPDREDRNIVLSEKAFPGPGGTPAVLTLFGDQDIGNQHVLAFDWGYRVQVVERLSVDLAAFYNHYRDLNSIDPAPPFLVTAPAPAHYVFPQDFGNQTHGKGYGAELSVGWQVTNLWKLSAGYSYLGLKFRPNPGTPDAVPELDAGTNPRHQVQLRSQWNLPRHLEFDQSLFFVSKLASQQVPAYTRVDFRFGWHPYETTEISIVGQNLFSGRHLEFPDFEQNTSTQDVRKVFAKITWRF